MSAINGYVRSDAAFLLADGLSYLDGIPQDVNLIKTHRLHGLNAVLSATGPAQLGEWMSTRLVYRTFDDLIETADWQIKHFFHRYAREFCNSDAVSCVVLAGWHEKEDRPAIYCVELQTAGSPKAISLRQNAGFVEERHVAVSLRELSIVAMPPPSREEFRDAAFDLIADVEKVDPASYLLHLMEIQRRRRFDGRHVVGGHAVLTTITASEVTQRVVHVWPEDRPGKRIEPAPIDWAAWQAERVGGHFCD